MSPRKSATWWLGGCVALLLAAAPAFAQSGNVTGVVNQSGTGQPLEGAVVQIEGTSISAVTAANGRYLLLNVPAGTHTQVRGALAQRSPGSSWEHAAGHLRSVARDSYTCSIDGRARTAPGVS